jgi:hypothetical protein
MKRGITSLLKSTAGLAALGLYAFGASSAHAQDPQDENAKPKPAAHAPMIDNGDQDTPAVDPGALHPDTTPLTGVLTPGIGTVEFRHSYFVPGVEVATTAQTGGAGNGWFDTTYLAGNASLVESWAHSHFALNYSGGGYFSTDGAQGNGAYQQLAAGQTWEWRRGRLDLLDQFAYLPASQFGFGGLSNLGAPGVGGSLSPGLNNISGVYVPTQTIFSSNGPRYDNSFAAQGTFYTSPRGSFTFVGSYGLLRFTESGNIGNDDIIGSIGYNYEVTKKDSIGVLYRFTGYHFQGEPQALGDHAFNLAYGRKVTGRLGLSLFAGPEITTFRVPIGTTDQQTGLSFGSALNYGFERGVLTISYTHGTNGGSGLLAGASGDNLTASITRQITRQWTARGNFGYGRTHAFTANSISGPAFNTYYLGAGLDRPIGRNAELSFGYTAYIQNNNSAACGALGICSGSGTSTQHQIAVGFQWHTRPFVIR